MPRNIQLIEPPQPRHRLYHLAGVVILALNQLRYRFRGYRSPRPPGLEGIGPACNYCEAVVNNWLRHLEHYQGHEVDLSGYRILEIGPGPDMGCGLRLLARGAEGYVAVDANPLIDHHSREYQLGLARAVAEHEGTEGEALDELVAEVAHLLDGEPGALHYHHLPEFDLDELADLGETRCDLLVSHSALEHVDNLPFTLQQLAGLANPGARLVFEIDLQTHTRWIRDHDPMNIYRYGENFYRGFAYRGQPNRGRPEDYVELLEAHGWCDARLYPKRVLSAEYIEEIEPHLDSRFQGDPEQLGWLEMVICATRRKGDDC